MRQCSRASQAVPFDWACDPCAKVWNMLAWVGYGDPQVITSAPDHRLAAAEVREQASSRWCKTTCDKASPAVAVMLHLRSCYVSKAAILTVPAQLCRSKIEVPLEFQGLGSLGAGSWRRFFPCEFDSN